MSLSANGEKLLPAAQRVLAELAKLQPLFETPLNGRIRVGIPDDFDEGVLERTLADFTQTNPGVEVLATSGCTATFPGGDPERRSGHRGLSQARMMFRARQLHGSDNRFGLRVRP